MSDGELEYDRLALFSDAVAAIAITLLAIDLPVPQGIFRYLKRADGRLRAINTVWLLALILNPFATKLLTSSGPETAATESLQSGSYALIQVLESAAVLAMLQHISSHQQAPDAPRSAMTDTAWRSWSVILAFWIVGLLFAQLRQLRHTDRAVP